MYWRIQNFFYVIIVTLFLPITAVLAGNDNILEKLSKKFDKLPCFGYDFFSSPKDELIVKMPLSDEYLVKPKDEFIISIQSDAINQKHIQTVTDEGYLEIPRIGRVYVAGDSLKKAKEKLMRQIKNSHKLLFSSENKSSATTVNINLGKLAGTRVMVTGNVKKRGLLLLEGADSSIRRVLYEAQGILPSGSLRQIYVKMNDKTVSQFDLYKFLVDGEYNQKLKYLKDGDAVFVPKKGKEAFIDGAVVNPGIYELLPDETLKDLLRFAGGFRRDANYEKIQIIRQSGTHDLILMDIPIINNDVSIPLKNQDKIIISTKNPNKIANVIIIKGGGIRNPGIYEYKNGMTLQKLINQAGGLTPNAQKMVFIQRMNSKMERSLDQIDLAKNLNTSLKAMDKVIIFSYKENSNLQIVILKGHVQKPGTYMLKKQERLSSVIQQAGGMDKIAFPEATVVIRNSKRLIVNIKEALKKPGSSEDIVMVSGDLIYVPVNDSSIKVIGEVLSPRLISFRDGKPAEYYVGLCGGTSSNAGDNIKIIRPGGEIVDVSSGIFSHTRLTAGCTVIVPPKDEKKLVDLLKFYTVEKIIKEITGEDGNEDKKTENRVEEKIKPENEDVDEIKPESENMDKIKEENGNSTKAKQINTEAKSGAKQAEVTS